MRRMHQVKRSGKGGYIDITTWAWGLPEVRPTFACLLVPRFWNLKELASDQKKYPKKMFARRIHAKQDEWHIPRSAPDEKW